MGAGGREKGTNMMMLEANSRDRMEKFLNGGTANMRREMPVGQQGIVGEGEVVNTKDRGDGKQESVERSLV